jgi:hypothetical protein
MPVEKLCAEGINIVNHHFDEYPITKRDCPIQQMYWTKENSGRNVMKMPLLRGPE